MSQAQSGHSNGAPLGVQAAAAATTTSGGKPAASTPAAPAGNKPASPPTTPAAATTTPAPAPAEGATAEEKKDRNKLYIVVGQVHEFETFAQAEKFLNADGAPTQYSVLRGKPLQSKQKVTLR